jgi:hypothetical protein
MSTQGHVVLCAFFIGLSLPRMAFSQNRPSKSPAPAEERVVRARPISFTKECNEINLRKPDPDYVPPGCDLYYRVVVWDTLSGEYDSAAIIELYGPRRRFVRIDESTFRQEGETLLRYRVICYRRSVRQPDAEGNYKYVTVHEEEGEFPDKTAWFHLIVQTRVFELPFFADVRSDDLTGFFRLPGPDVFIERSTPERYDSNFMRVPPLSPAYPVIKFLVDRFPNAPISPRIRPTTPPLDPTMRVSQPLTPEEMSDKLRRVREEKPE